MDFGVDQFHAAEVDQFHAAKSTWPPVQPESAAAGGRARSASEGPASTPAVGIRARSLPPIRRSVRGLRGVEEAFGLCATGGLRDWRKGGNPRAAAPM